MLTADFIPQHSELGRQSLTAGTVAISGKQRQILRLIDGSRRLDQLAVMLPGRDVPAELADLMTHGLVLPPPGLVPTPRETARRPLPEGWRAAMIFMKDQASQAMGVMAGPILALLDGADNADAARHAVARWHMAMRESRHGRENADNQLTVVTRMLGI